MDIIDADGNKTTLRPKDDKQAKLFYKQHRAIEAEGGVIETWKIKRLKAFSTPD